MNVPMEQRTAPKVISPSSESPSICEIQLSREVEEGVSECNNDMMLGLDSSPSCSDEVIEVCTQTLV